MHSMVPRLGRPWRGVKAVGEGVTVFLWRSSIFVNGWNELILMAGEETPSKEMMAK